MFTEKFNTDDGLAHLVPAEWLPAKELPNDEYPFVLNTGRLLEHWHTGSMTRRSFALDAIQPRPEVYMHPADAAELRARRRRDGAGELAPRDDRARGQGVAQGGARQLLHPVPLPRGGRKPADDRRDRPVGKIPEFKFCAVKIEPATNGERVRGSRLMAVTNGRVPGREARAGKFPGPSLIPSLNAIQREHGWLPPRGAGPPVPRDAPAAVRDRGTNLVLSALPHGGAAQGRGHRLPRPVVLAPRRGRADRRDPRALRRRRRDRGPRGLVHRAVRHRPGRDRRGAAGAGRRRSRGGAAGARR